MTLALTSGYVPRCIGRVAELHATFYSAAARFGLSFEAKVARELADFCERYDAARDGMWFVTDGGHIEGSLVVDGVHAEAEGAHLRWFITSERVRGKGFGQRLLRQGLAFADGRGYKRVHLWTFEGLDAARHLYEKHGFHLERATLGSQWGTRVNEQLFVRSRA